MADQVANRALGRVAEWYVRVDGNDPANAVLHIEVLATAGNKVFLDMPLYRLSRRLK